MSSIFLKIVAAGCLFVSVPLFSLAAEVVNGVHGVHAVHAIHGADEPPNIIFFLSDDHRADVLGCAGHPVVQTPNIDTLAENGVRFANAFVTTSICAASRATILTGLVERTHGYTFGTPPLAQILCDESYPAILKANGYRTGFVGKFGVNVEGGRATTGKMFNSFEPVGRGMRETSDGTKRHFTDTAGDKAIEFLRAGPPRKPFCLSVSFNAAHATDGDKENHFPYPASEAELYTDVEMPRPRLDGGAYFDSQPAYLKESMNRDRYFWRWDTPEKYDRNMRNYLRMLSGMDRNIGRVLAELDAQGKAENTIIIFMGDNGYYMGERGFAGKWSHYDESLRVPLVIYDPRVPVEQRGRVVDSIALNLDISATILDAAQIAATGNEQGRSLMPVVGADGDVTARTQFFCEHLMKHAAIPRWQGIRSERYKYAKYLDAEEDAEHLYDLKADPDELVNLVDREDYAEVLEEMRGESERMAVAYEHEYAAIREPRPRILMLGDSISMGYHRYVVQAFRGEAVVVRPGENCAGTTKGIAKIDEWLALEGGDFDIIHFNFGLHDLKRVKPDGKNSNDPDDAQQADLIAYERNLRQIVDALEATGAELVFATTTPVPLGVKPYRAPEESPQYNAVALRVMREHGIAIDDLYAFSLGQIEEIQNPANVHFTQEGSKVLAAEVTRHLRRMLKRVDAK